MSSEYTSSITSRYGDIDKVSRDSSVVWEILERQGTNLLIDIIAEHCGRVANRHRVDAQGRANIMNGILHDMNEALGERL